MFGKKQPPTPKLPWDIQLLTPDYVVQGHMDGDDPTGGWFLNVQPSDLAVATLKLTQASVQPTGALNVNLPTGGTWLLPSTAQFVAVIPRDEASTAYAIKNKGHSQHPIPVVVFVGPYAIRGTVLSPDTYLDILSDYQTFAMQDVVIDCLTPGARLTGLTAPYIVVRSLLLHGILVNA